MYTSAAAWLMTELDTDPLMVSLVQVASSLPMFLFALPAGALADIVDRRRYLLAAESLITATRESSSRPEAGIVSCLTRGLNQDGAEILRFNRSVMVWRRGAADKASRFPTAATPLAAG